MRLTRTVHRYASAQHTAQWPSAVFLARSCAMLAVATSLAACDRPADVASRNLSQAADNFEINRRVVFYNGITGDYILSIEGLCAGSETTP